MNKYNRYSPCVYSHRKQVKELGKFFTFSFLWGFFQWFYTAGENCGFEYFPSLGLKAFDNRYLSLLLREMNC